MFLNFFCFGAGARADQNWCSKCYSCYSLDCFYNESVIISSHLCGFIRFLNHMAKFDWENQPLVVNINDDIKGQFY